MLPLLLLGGTMKKLKEVGGSITINGSFILLLIFASLAIAMSFFGIVNRTLKIHTMANELLRYTEVRGQVDSSVYGELARLQSATGIDADCTITAIYLSGGTKVQFGEPISVYLEDTSSLGLGGVIQVPVKIHATVIGRSERYWK